MFPISEMDFCFSYTSSLRHADLSAANVSQADFRLADLSAADLSDANLALTDLSAANVSGADFSGARSNGTHFADIDLSPAKGLGAIQYDGPSTIGINTIYKSRGEIAEGFLRGCGVPDEFIGYIGSIVGRPIEFYSCFISYSTKDPEFGERLYNDLQRNTDGFINCPGTCTHTYNPNTPVTLNASAAQGWAFSGWTGAYSGGGPCNLVMTANLALTAVFVEPGHGIEFTAATPCRLVDTRNPNGPFGGPPMQGGTVRSFALPTDSNCDIPSSATAYSLNVAVAPHGHLGFDLRRTAS